MPSIAIFTRNTGRLAAAAFAMACCADASAGLAFTLGDNGLTSLTYDHRQLLANSRSGNIRLAGQTPKIEGADGVVLVPLDKPRVVPDPNGRRIRQEYPWGVVESSYAQIGERLALSVRVTNTSATMTIQALDLDVFELAFASIPKGRVLEAGMFGTGGGWRPLYEMPLVAKSDQMPPIILVRFDGGALAFTNDADPGATPSPTVSIPFTSNPTTRLSYPLRVSLPPIAAGGTARAEVSVRFGDSDAGTEDLAGDVLQRFREAYPYEVNWPDRRPIGALFLATSQKHPEKNPRGWFANSPDVDVTTPEGLEKWRARLMKYADDSIKVLKDLDAQGMITWDPEGEEFAAATFYGDPRLASRLAPETDFRGRAAIGALDEYFGKFQRAGLRTGLTLRPQAIAFKNGVPAQTLVDDPRQELLDKIAYARSRWGCTLFYIDSTYDKVGALNADVIEALTQLHPDVLLMPENENLRHYAYSAPFNSFTHAGVTSTPASVREAYGQAFSTLLVTTTEEKMRAGRDALVDAVRRGDVLIVNAWYGGKHIDAVKSIYEDASR